MVVLKEAPKRASSFNGRDNPILAGRFNPIPDTDFQTVDTVAVNFSRACYSVMAQIRAEFACDMLRGGFPRPQFRSS